MDDFGTIAEGAAGAGGAGDTIALVFAVGGFVAGGGETDETAGTLFVERVAEAASVGAPLVDNSWAGVAAT